jgi:ribose transport system permease protein
VIISAGIDLSVGRDRGPLILCGGGIDPANQIGGQRLVNPFLDGHPSPCWSGLWRRIQRFHHHPEIPDFIATLGTLAIFRGVALLITDGLPIPSHLTANRVERLSSKRMIWMGSSDLLGIPVAGWIALLVAVIGWFILRYTALGRSVYAVGGNREAARVSGINIDRTKLAVYAISGITAAIGGFVLAGRLNSANALMAEEENLRSIAAVVIGGTNLFGGEGGVFGSMIGALIMGVLGNGMNLINLSAFWQRIIQGVVIILVVVFDQWRRRRFVIRR